MNNQEIGELEQTLFNQLSVCDTTGERVITFIEDKNINTYLSKTFGILEHYQIEVVERIKGQGAYISMINKNGSCIEGYKPVNQYQRKEQQPVYNNVVGF